jgi:hypothetical protein
VVTPLLRRQIAFLGFMAAFAVLELVVGSWELALNRSPHQLMLGTIVLALTVRGWRQSRRPLQRQAEAGAD